MKIYLSVPTYIQATCTGAWWDIERSSTKSVAKKLEFLVIMWSWRYFDSDHTSTNRNIILHVSFQARKITNCWIIRENHSRAKVVIDFRSFCGRPQSEQPRQKLDEVSHLAPVRRLKTVSQKKQPVRSSKFVRLCTGLCKIVDFSIFRSALYMISYQISLDIFQYASC